MQKYGNFSRLVTRPQVDSMLSNGLEVIACGANVPFIDDDVFFGKTAKYADANLSVIPDFIANCGMARVFAYLMQKDAALTDESIFFDVSQIIKKALEKTHSQNQSVTHISSTALDWSLSQLLS
jgi:glutamate dehydrogenase/leucine dehydrogenase